MAIPPETIPGHSYSYVEPAPANQHYQVHLPNDCDIIRPNGQCDEGDRIKRGPKTISCRTTDNEGTCIQECPDDFSKTTCSPKILGNLFSDGFFLRRHEAYKPYTEWWLNSSITHGIISYRGLSYSINNGTILDEKQNKVGDVFTGGFRLYTQNQCLGGSFFDFPGLSAELYIEKDLFFDSMPEEGTAKIGNSDYFVSNSLLYAYGSSGPVGTIDSQGDISWASEGQTHLLSEKTFEARLIDSRKGIVLEASRDPQTIDLNSIRKIVPRFGEINHRPAVDVLGFSMSYDGLKNITVLVRAKPLFAGSISQEDKKELLNRINDTLMEKLSSKYYLQSKDGKRYQLRYQMEFVSQGEDGEILFYWDKSKACIEGDRREHACHNLRPNVHLLNIGAVRYHSPHEFLHYLGNEEEYPDTRVPERKVGADTSSIMYSHGGELRAQHLKSMLELAKDLIDPSLELKKM